MADPVTSILDSTKKALGLSADYDVFDPDIIMHINGVFSTLNQLGIGPDEGFAITGADEVWDTFLGSDKRFNIVKTYVWLRVKYLFDPPSNAFVMTAMKEQIAEHEWRISVLRESEQWGSPVTVIVPE